MSEKNHICLYWLHLTYVVGPYLNTVCCPLACPVEASHAWRSLEHDSILNIVQATQKWASFHIHQTPGGCKVQARQLQQVLSRNISNPITIEPHSHSHQVKDIDVATHICYFVLMVLMITSNVWQPCPASTCSLKVFMTEWIEDASQLHQRLANQYTNIGAALVKDHSRSTFFVCLYTCIYNIWDTLYIVN